MRRKTAERSGFGIEALESRLLLTASAPVDAIPMQISVVSAPSEIPAIYAEIVDLPAAHLTNTTDSTKSGFPDVSSSAPFEPGTAAFGSLPPRNEQVLLESLSADSGPISNAILDAVLTDLAVQENHLFELSRLQGNSPSQANLVAEWERAAALISEASAFAFNPNALLGTGRSGELLRPAGQAAKPAFALEVADFAGDRAPLLMLAREVIGWWDQRSRHDPAFPPAPTAPDNDTLETVLIADRFQTTSLALGNSAAVPSAAPLAQRDAEQYFGTSAGPASFVEASHQSPVASPEGPRVRRDRLGTGR